MKLSEIKTQKKKVTIEQEYDYDVLSDIVCTAVEGGIGYFACLRNDLPEWEEARAIVKAELGETPCYHEVILYMLFNNIPVTFEDAEYSEIDDNEEPEVWQLTLDKLLNGMVLYEQQYRNINKQLEDGSFDAGDADVIFQLALFGEIVYG